MATDQFAMAVTLRLVLQRRQPSSFSQSSLLGRSRLSKIRESRRKRLVAHQRRQSRRKALLLIALATCALAQCVPRRRRIWTLPRYVTYVKPLNTDLLRAILTNLQIEDLVGEYCFEHLH